MMLEVMLTNSIAGKVTVGFTVRGKLSELEKVEVAKLVKYDVWPGGGVVRTFD